MAKSMTGRISIRRLVFPITAGVLVVSSPLDASASTAVCGDGEIDVAQGEECEDGNELAGDGCSPACLVECTEIGDAATEHTCQHGEFGPFVDVVGQTYPGFVFTDVSRQHTYFTLTLSGEPGENRSGALFTATASVSYAVYMHAPYPLALRNLETDELVPVRMEHALDPPCPNLAWVRLFEPLDYGAIYVVDIGPWDEPTVGFAFERLNGFSSLYSLDQDEDGYAGMEATAESGCVPPAPYMLGLGDDCDDENASIYPGSEETCDNIDPDPQEDTGIDEDGSGSGSETGSFGEETTEESGTSGISATGGTSGDAAGTGTTGGASGDTGTSSSGGSAGGTTGTDGGTSGGGTETGTTQGAVDTTTGGPTTGGEETGEPMDPSEEDSSGCGCHVDDHRGGGPARGLAFLLGAFLLISRRRRARILRRR